MARQLPTSTWRRVTWRQGSRGAQRSRFVMLKVWAAHGWQQQAHPPRVREWLLVEWPQGEPEPTKYWLAQLGTQPLGLRRLVLATPPHRLTTDQRGLPRPDLGESACDIGAYELQDTIDFSHFSGSMQIDPDAGVFNLSGGFTLGTGGIFNPASNSVTFSVGSYSVTVPAGRFVRTNTGYVYQGTVNGIFASVSIQFTSTPGKYVLLAMAGGVIPATTSPVPVSLYSGNSSGSTQMNATFD